MCPNLLVDDVWVQYGGMAERASSWFGQIIGRTANRREIPMNSRGPPPQGPWGARKEPWSLEKQSHYQHHSVVPVISPKGWVGSRRSPGQWWDNAHHHHSPTMSQNLAYGTLERKWAHLGPPRPCTQGIMQLHVIMIMPRRGFRNAWLHDSGWSIDSWVLCDYGSSMLL